MSALVPRTRSSLWIPQGEGPSGRSTVSSMRSRGFLWGRTAQVVLSERVMTVRSSYDDERYQEERYGSRRAPATDQRRRPQTQYDYDFAPPPGSSRPPPGPPNTPPGGPQKGPDDGNNRIKNYLIAGAFFIGMGTGVWFNSGASFTPSNVASTEIVDRRTPNSEICISSGYSSMVFDQRIFVSFNPFNVYVAQPEVKPGCVLRQSNVNVLEKRKLVNDKEVSACTRSSNTFAFVGDLDQSPEVSCVYHSEDAENQFLRNPKRAVLGDGFRGSDASSPTPSSPSKPQ